MPKKLSEMTKTELWQLFPIVLTPHRPEWEKQYDDESAMLASVMPYAIIRHIGSTAINGIWAKPIVDILVEVADEKAMAKAKSAITEAGYREMWSEGNRASFNKGYTENGFADRVFHLHLRLFGDNDELYFRDYMNDNPSLAKEYESLKLGLWKKFEHNRDGYTKAKTDFIKRHTADAKKRYGDRYGK